MNDTESDLSMLYYTILVPNMVSYQLVVSILRGCDHIPTTRIIASVQYMLKKRQKDQKMTLHTL